MSAVKKEPSATPLLKTTESLVIEGRKNFPDLTFDYVMDVVKIGQLEGASYTVITKGEQEEHKTYTRRLHDVQFTYPQPADPKATHGTCAHAWFADRGDWIYALEKTQSNAYVPYSMPEWLRLLSHQVHAASKKTRLVGSGWNCCLLSYGTHSVWSFGEDPWHSSGNYVAELFIGEEDVCVTLSHENGSSFSMNPAKGSIIAWRGEGSTLSVRSDKPFFRLSFRVIEPVKIDRQKDAKMPRRLAEALEQEQRLVPLHLKTDQRDAIIQGQRPPTVRASIPPTPAAPKKKTTPTVQVKREVPASVLREQEAEEASTTATSKKKLKKAPPAPFK